MARLHCRILSTQYGVSNPQNDRKSDPVAWMSNWLRIKQKDLAIFDGKIRGKAQSTRELFLDANGFDENAVVKFSGDSPRIILMTGEDQDQ